MALPPVYFICECVEYQVANNPEKARKMNQQADDIEDAQSKEHADLSAAVTIFATGSALDPSREDVCSIIQGSLSEVMF